MNMDQYIDQIFDSLDKWRNFPSYQLERRADIFISMYLREFLEEHLKEMKDKSDKVQAMIPEFPIFASDNDYGMDHIDYFVKTKNNLILLIELKTDGRSVTTRQKEYLKRAQKKKLSDLLTELKEKYKHVVEETKDTNTENKYKCLLCELDKSKLISGTDTDFTIVDQGTTTNYVIYILPNEKDKEKFEKDMSKIDRKKAKVFTLVDLSWFIWWKQDEFSLRFSRSLRRWAELKAGLDFSQWEG